MQQQVLEPHHAQVAPAAERFDGSGLEDAGALRDLRVAPPVRGFGDLALGALVVLDIYRDDAAPAVAQIEDERRVEGAQAVEVGGIEPTGRGGEADGRHTAGGP